jgi:hypothetical protein
MRAISSPFRAPGLFVLAGVLVGLVGCGGTRQASSGSATSAPAPTVASTLVYTAPSTGSYQLVRDPASTSTHLILGLVGPQGAQVKGAVLSLNVDGATASWSNPGGSDPYIREGQVLALGTGTKLLKSQLSGTTLQAAIFQKGSVAAATLGSQPLFSVALDLKAGARTGAVNLSSASAQILDAAGATQAITVAVGSLVAQ